MYGLSDRQTSLFADRGKRGDLSAYADDQRQGELIEIHDEDAAFTAEKLNEGKDVVFLTIGDPSIYSTCMYIHKRLKMDMKQS